MVAFGLGRWLAVSAAVLAMAVGACDGAEPPLVLPGVGDGGSGPTNQGEAMFRAMQADVVKACGACHKKAGTADTPFLGDPDTNDPDPYEAISSWPEVIVKDADGSVLITWPRYGQHSAGPTDPELEETLHAWLAEEAKWIDGGDGKPTIPPFKPIVPGFNAVYLTALGPDFVGMAVTFTASELTEGALSLTEIEVHPTDKLGLRFEHPLFTVYPGDNAEGDPDPVDSFSNLVQEVEAGQSAPLGPGLLVLTNWKGGGRLSLNFQIIDVVDPTAGAGGAGSVGSCVALPEFDTNAAPLFALNCVTCHGGDNQTATNAMNMTQLATDSTAACGQIRTRINPMDPPSSQIFLNTNPNGNASHPFKFGGNVNDFNAFRSAVSIWIQAEAP